MPSAARQFLLDLANRVSELVDRTYVPHGKSSPALRRPTDNGYVFIDFAGSAKYSPFLSVALTYGRRFHTPYRVPDYKLRLRPLEPSIHNLSYNWRRCEGTIYQGPSTWSVDIRAPEADLADSIVPAIQELVAPFAARYPTLRAARDALERGDSWCIGGPVAWSSMVDFDFALQDFEHFSKWSMALEPFYKQQADERLSNYISTGRHVA
jgi:hypothetical protein